MMRPHDIDTSDFFRDEISKNTSSKVMVKLSFAVNYPLSNKNLDLIGFESCSSVFGRGSRQASTPIGGFNLSSL